ncbi:MAG: hypothetical protein ACK5MP_05555 [Nostocoides sp.]
MPRFVPVSIGASIGGVIAMVAYAQISPGAVLTAAPSVPTFPPVPTPTATVLADCVAPAELVGRECVVTVHKPGPVITISAPAAQSRAAVVPVVAGTTSAPAPASLSKRESERESEHESVHESEHESDHDGDGHHADEDD